MPRSSAAGHLIFLTLSVTLLLMLTCFYARKDWKSYTKHSLCVLFIIDMVIAGLYHFVIFFNPVNEYTTCLLTEIGYGRLSYTDWWPVL